MKTDWEEIYKSKTNRELYKIFLNGTYSEKTLSRKILTERNFDFDNISRYSSEWELERLINEEKEFSNNICQKYSGWAFGVDVLAVAPIFIILMIIIITGYLVFQISGFSEKDIGNTLVALGGAVISEFLFIWLFNKRERTRHERAERIRYLKEMIEKESKR